MTRTFESVAASLAAMAPEALSVGMWTTVRGVGPTMTGKVLVVFLAVYGRVNVGSGAAVIDIEQLASDLAQSPRAIMTALRRFEHAGWMLSEVLDDRRRRVTLPCLIGATFGKHEVEESARVLH